MYTQTIEALKRDNYSCQECGSTKNVVVHHKDNKNLRPYGFAGFMDNSIDNLITLCRPCHAIAHGQGLRYKRISIDLIDELRANGKTYQEIGEHLGVSRQRIHQIIKRRTI